MTRDELVQGAKFWLRGGVVIQIPAEPPRGFCIISWHWFRWSAVRKAKVYAAHGFRATVWDWRPPFHDRLGEHGFVAEFEP
jgi:hypothetical protein